MITGQVVDATTGKPLSAAVVAITNATYVDAAGIPEVGSSPFVRVPTILTGADGRFVFRGLRAGNFWITSTKGGYEEGASGRRRPAGATQPAVLIETDRSIEIVVRMWKHGAIGGAVIDEAGEPVVGVQVRALARVFAGGRDRYGASGPPALTDDRGMYRFSSLPAGEYVVVASARTVAAPLSAMSLRGLPSEVGAAFAGVPGNADTLQIGDALYALGRGIVVPPPPVDGRMLQYPPVFHPSALVPAEAAVIALGFGEERSGVDVQLQPVPSVRVSGVLTAPQPGFSPTAVRLMPSGFDDVSLEQDAPLSATDVNGVFIFPAVPPGRYTLRAAARPRPAGSGGDEDPGLWLAVPLSVGGDDLDGVAAAMLPGLHVSGRFEFEGAAERPAAARLAQIPVMIETVDGSPPLPGAAVAAHQDNRSTGTFRTPGYPAGKYLLRIGGSPQGWMFKSAMLEGRDLSESPFDLTRDISGVVVTFTDRWSGLGGSVQGAGADGATIVVFPANSGGWTNYGLNPRRLRSARASAAGTFGSKSERGDFSLSSLPPGDYYVAAIPEEASARWRDPKVLEALSRVATHVTVIEGEHKMVELRVKDVIR
jgi:hypothetical protein